jgi:S1-C subfamily serine protease
MADNGHTPAAVLVHLTGTHRGNRQQLTGGSVLIGTSEDAPVHFPTGTAGVAPRHATFIQEDDRWILWAEPQEAVFVNGERIEEHGLQAGDLLRVGHGGPILRFRIQDEPPGEYKSMTQAVQDCLDCARYGSDSRLGRLVLLLAGIPRELLTQTAPAVRLVALGVVAALLVTVFALGAYTIRVERRLDEESRRLATIEAAVRDAVVADDESQVGERLAELQTGLTERIEALESRSEAGRRIVADASGSVMLLQGAYGFLDAETRQPLRFVLGPQGRPQPAPWGGPMVSPDGDGPRLQRFFTGSAFLVMGGLPEDARLHTNLLVTNRHVVRPWEFAQDARAFVEQGYVPEIRLLGYLPGISEPYQIQVVAASEHADVAVLYAPELAGMASPLALGESSPDPGAEVIVLGYPTGLSALLARTEAALVDSLVEATGPDFWELALRLSQAGLVRPLATQGIVGQVTRASVVYDAETTQGGSGGPVLDLDGRVVAVTVGVMEDFGGSNLGVPVEHIRRLLEDLAASRIEPDSTFLESISLYPDSPVRAAEPASAEAPPDTGGAE